MEFLLKLFKGPIKRIVKKKLADEELQRMLVDRLNAKLDIPKLDEVEEEKLFNAVYDASEEALLIAIDRI
jgi:hypothetical protein